jgi:RsiW-degrading membrane proteinase PrsW (M82 family)
MNTIERPMLIKRIPTALLPWIPALIGILLLWVRGISPYNLLQAGFLPIVFLLQLWFFLSPFRTVTAREITSGFVAGISITSPLIWISATLMDAFVRQKPISAFFKSKSVFGSMNITATVVAPITEEIWKVAVPMLMLFLLTHWGSRPMAKARTPVDFLILSASSGAGFELFENLFRVVNRETDVLWPAFKSSISWGIGPFKFFPDMYANRFYSGDMIWLGHVGTAAVMGLAIGLFYHSRKKGLTILLPIVAVLASIWDHMLFNYNIHRSKIWWKSTLGNITLQGRLLPILYFVMLAIAVLLIVRRYQWYFTTRSVHLYPPPRKKGFTAFLSYLPKHRHVLMAAFSLHEALHDGRKRAEKYAPFVGTLVRNASVYQQPDDSSGTV